MSHLSLLLYVGQCHYCTVLGFGMKYVLTCCAAAPCGIAILSETELGEDVGVEVGVEGGEEGSCRCCTSV
jgi:hypothetical protein